MTGPCANALQSLGIYSLVALAATLVKLSWSFVLLQIVQTVKGLVCNEKGYVGAVSSLEWDLLSIVVGQHYHHHHRHHDHHQATTHQIQMIRSLLLSLAYFAVYLVLRLLS